MIRRGYVGAFVALCCFVASPLVGRADAIPTTMNAAVAGKRGVGLVVGVIDHGSVRTYTAGGLGDGAPALDARTEFQIGSVTKTFTAALLAAMVESGEVNLDDPISRYLPAGVTAPTYRGQPITLLNLAEQNSGLPALPSNMEQHLDPYSQYTAAQLDAFLWGYALTRAPGSQYEYSNLGVGLLGDLLAARERTSYGALLQRWILNPLGLTSTSVTPSADMLARLAPGRSPFLGTAPNWHFSELAGCGAIYSDLEDMLRYLRANLAAPEGTLGRAMALAQMPRAGAQNERIGLIWMTTARTGITWHNGWVGGYRAFIGIDRAKDTGVVVLVNSGDVDPDAIGLGILSPNAVAATTAVPGEDSAITVRVKALYASYVSGSVDTSQMTLGFAKLFTPEFISRLQSGTQRPSAWVFVASAPDAGATRYDYRLTFAGSTQIFSVWIDPDGKIAGSRLSGDE